MSETQESAPGQAGELHVRFVDTVAKDDVVLLRFKDPAPRYAVKLQGATAGEQTGETAGDTLEVALLPLQQSQPDFSEWLQDANPAETPPAYVKYRGVELLWRPCRAMLQCDAEQVEALLPGLVEFQHYERELRRLEEEIAGTWAEAEEDNRLAFDVTSADLRRSQVVGERMERVLRRRMRLARIEAHLYAPHASLSAAARKLGQALREQAGTEARAEIVDGQLEVFEHLYEMSAQRMGEYRASRQGNIMEWVIVVLLAAETLLLVVQAIWK